MSANAIQITINDQKRALGIKEYRRQRVVTFRDVDMLHGRPNGTARKRFNDNKHRFVLKDDYFEISQPSEFRTLGLERPQGGTAEKIILLTQSGYLMLVKSFNDDIAWQVQRQLVNCYFRAKRTQAISPDTILMRKLKVANSIARGLPRAKQLELRLLAVMEAAKESGADYSAILAVLEAPEAGEKGQPYDSDRDVDLFLQEVAKGLNRYHVQGNYIVLPPSEERRLCERLDIDRTALLRELDERSMLRVAYGWNNGTRKKNYTHHSAFYGRKRCVHLKLNCINIHGE